MRRLTHHLMLLATVTCGPMSLLGQEPSTTPRPSAEEDRLKVGVFRAALKKRGLTELLNLHQADFPPKNEVDALLLTHELRLAEFADRSRGIDHRQAAISEANTILLRLITEHGPDLGETDPRFADWQFTLLRSLLYEEGEPLITSILYHGGTASQRLSLRPLTAQAVSTASALLDYLRDEFERLDGLAIDKFERLERTGYVERLDQLEPQVRYVRLWAWFYDSLAYEAGDARRAERLTQVANGIAEMRVLVTTPHEDSGVQVQVHALLGMTYRRLNKDREARDALRSAIRIGERITDPDERARVAWAVQLANIENIRNERNAGRFSAAADAVDSLMGSLDAGEDSFSLRLVTALEAREVQRAWSASAARHGQRAESAAHRKAGWRALQSLCEAFPRRCGDVYAVVNERLKPPPAPESMDPFDRCAVLVGLLQEAGASEDPEPLLRKALTQGSAYVTLTVKESPELANEMRFQLAVAEYQLGRTRAAAEQFLVIALAHDRGDTPFRATKLAVELAARLKSEPETDAAVETLYLDALARLVQRYPKSEETPYWRFYYAQQLDHMARYDEAAVQYARVQESHEHYTEGLFLRLRALTLALTELTERRAVEPAEAHRRMEDVFEAYRTFLTVATKDMERTPAGQSTWQHLLARARVLVGEAQLLPLVEQYQAAIDTVTGFESSFPKEQALGARVWRIRLTAYQQLGRLEEAGRAIPAYLAAEPNDAGPVLQRMFGTVTEALRQGSLETTDAAQQRQAEIALILAQHIETWSHDAPTTLTPGTRRAIAVQLAEANLWSGHYDEALRRFDELNATSDAALDRRVMLGRAETLYQLQRYDDALPIFNTLASRLATSDPARWRGLLRDLQCRTAMKHDPGGIIHVIEQQSFLYPDLGGPVLASKFQELLRHNQRRRDTP